MTVTSERSGNRLISIQRSRTSSRSLRARGTATGSRVATPPGSLRRRRPAIAAHDRDVRPEAGQRFSREIHQADPLLHQRGVVAWKRRIERLTAVREQPRVKVLPEPLALQEGVHTRERTGHGRELPRWRWSPQKSHSTVTAHTRTRMENHRNETPRRTRLRLSRTSFPRRTVGTSYASLLQTLHRTGGVRREISLVAVRLDLPTPADIDEEIRGLFAALAVAPKRTTAKQASKRREESTRRFRRNRKDHKLAGSPFSLCREDLFPHSWTPSSLLFIRSQVLPRAGGLALCWAVGKKMSRGVYDPSRPSLPGEETIPTRSPRRSADGPDRPMPRLRRDPTRALPAGALPGVPHAAGPRRPGPQPLAPGARRHLRAAARRPGHHRPVHRPGPPRPAPRHRAGRGARADRPPARGRRRRPLDPLPDRRRDRPRRHGRHPQGPRPRPRPRRGASRCSATTSATTPTWSAGSSRRRRSAASSSTPASCRSTSWAPSPTAGRSSP